MSVSISFTNRVSQRAQRHQASASQRVLESFERLGSGKRINSGGDDPAGLSLSSKLKSESTVYGQAVRNLNDGLNLIGTAEAALVELSRISDRQLELAEQAANGVYTNRQRLALDTEAQALTDEYGRIIATTTYNELHLFGDDLRRGVRLQAGIGLEESLELRIGGSLSFTAGDGTFTASGVLSPGGLGYTGIQLADMDGDSDLDLVTSNQNSAGIQLNDGAGNFGPRTSFAATQITVDVDVADFNGDGRLDVVTAAEGIDIGNDDLQIGFGDGSGGFSSTATINLATDIERLIVGDLDGDGSQDLVVAGATAQNLTIHFGQGNGSFDAPQVVATATYSSRDVRLADLDGDSDLDIVSSSTTNAGIVALLNNGGRTFSAPVVSASGSTARGLALADVDTDGDLDAITTRETTSNAEIYLNNGSGSFSFSSAFAVSGDPQYIETADVNGDGFSDVIVPGSAGNSVSVALGNGSGGFATPTSYSQGSGLRSTAVGDIDGDGAVDILSANDSSSNIGVFLGNPITTGDARGLSPAGISLVNQIGARNALATIQQNQERVRAELGNLGVLSVRVEKTISNLSNRRLNYDTALSRIEDADIAAESAQALTNTILQNQLTAVSAEANLSPGVALALIQGA